MSWLYSKAIEALKKDAAKQESVKLQVAKPNDKKIE